MRAPSQKAPTPRIRALTGANARVKAPQQAASRAAAPPAVHVFRDFVATIERLEKGRRRRKGDGAAAPAGKGE